MAINTLYPPIVDTYMPAFKVTEDKGEGICRIYFAISKYNELAPTGDNKDNDNKIRSIWISVTNQLTNVSLVNDDDFKSGLIYTSEIKIDNTKDGDNKYYVEINSSQLKNKKWERGQVYKVQLRFCSKGTIVNEARWPIENSSYFSEWSTITLIQGVLGPTIRINGFENVENETIFGTSDNTIVGSFTFNSLDNDFLNYYTLKLYKQSDLETILYDSGTIYTSSFAPNEIYHEMEYGLEDGIRYVLKMEYITDKLYSAIHEYNFMVLDTSGGYFDATISATPDNELGRIKISIKSDSEKGAGNFTIRRASSKTNFTIWEDVQNLSFNDGNYLDFSWYDYTIESGIWYKYCIQKRSRFGYRGIALIIDEPVMAFFDDMFLVGKNGRQLRIKFNPQINSYNHTILESSVQTIGSKYPFITRNGNVNYREFSISGLISHFMDEEQLFISHEKLYKGAFDLYKEYNEKNRIYLHNDFTLEREFRKEVQDFLLDGEVKLFKSATEGNILVKLMGVSFTPEATLGRMVYSFQANAVEIDNCNIKTLDKYNIQNIGSYTTVYLNQNEKSKIYEITSESRSVNLNSVIEQEEIYSSNETIRSLSLINDLEVQFECSPYLVKITSTGMEQVTNANITKNDKVVLGYIIKLNNNPILVGTHGYYFIQNGNFESVEIIVPKAGEKVRVNTKYTILEEENLATLSKVINYYFLLGQESGLYNPNDSILYDYVYAKYNARNEKRYQKLYSLDTLSIETEPNTVCYLQNNTSNKYNRILIGNTGFLKLGDNTDSYITDLFIAGVNLRKKEDYKDRLTTDWEFEDCLDVVPKDGVYLYDSDALENFLIENNKTLRKNGVYRVQNIDNIFPQKYQSTKHNYLSQLYDWTQPYEDDGTYHIIYYKDNWHIFTSNNDVICSSHALLTYTGEIERGEFAANET